MYLIMSLFKSIVSVLFWVSEHVGNGGLLSAKRPSFCPLVMGFSANLLIMWKKGRKVTDKHIYPILEVLLLGSIQPNKALQTYQALLVVEHFSLLSLFWQLGLWMHAISRVTFCVSMITQTGKSNAQFKRSIDFSVQVFTSPLLRLCLFLFIIQLGSIIELENSAQVQDTHRSRFVENTMSPL